MLCCYVAGFGVIGFSCIFPMFSLQTHLHRQQVYDMQQAGTDHSPESLLSRMEEENHLNSYLLNDKLPKVLCVTSCRNTKFVG